MKVGDQRDMPPPSADTIQAWLVAHLSEQLGIDAADFDPRKPFTYYGLSSEEAVRLSRKSSRTRPITSSP